MHTARAHPISASATGVGGGVRPPVALTALRATGLVAALARIVALGGGVAGSGLERWGRWIALTSVVALGGGVAGSGLERWGRWIALTSVVALGGGVAGSGLERWGRWIALTSVVALRGGVAGPGLEPLAGAVVLRRSAGSRQPICSRRPVGWHGPVGPRRPVRARTPVRSGRPARAWSARAGPSSVGPRPGVSWAGRARPARRPPLLRPSRSRWRPARARRPRYARHRCRRMIGMQHGRRRVPLRPGICGVWRPARSACAVCCARRARRCGDEFVCAQWSARSPLVSARSVKDHWCLPLKSDARESHRAPLS